MENDVREIIRRYKEMKIGKNVISCPYYMNVAKTAVVEMLKEADVSSEKIDKFSSLWREGRTEFGYLQGKGLPEEIATAALQITEKIGLSIEKADSEVAVEMLKHLGLGIDCSGFVFNVLKSAFEASDKLEELMDSLDWAEPEKRDSSRAGVFVFAGDASNAVDISALHDLDLILIKNHSNKYTHIAMLLSIDGGFEIAQSTILTVPTGVNLSKMKVAGGKPVFQFIPGLGRRWEEIFAEGRMEFRRLKALN